MSNFCSDCENILRAVDQLFTDGRINDFIGECYVSHPFASGVRGWTKAAKEGTCDLCVLTHSHPEHELMTKILSNISQDAELTWLLDWHLGDWVQLSLKCETGQYVGIEVCFQRKSMTDKEGSDALAKLPISTDVFPNYSNPAESVGWREGQFNVGPKDCKDDS